MKLHRWLLAATISCGLAVATLPVATAAPALAFICQGDGCPTGGGGGGGGGGTVPTTQTYGQDLTAITAFTNTGLSCTFGFPVVTVTFATRVANWTASVQCSGQVSDISGKAVFDTWFSPGSAIACSNNICGGVLPDFGPVTSVTVSGSATLTPGVSYGVQSEMAITPPPGQFFVTGYVHAGTSGPFFDCGPAGNTGYNCWLDTGPFSVPS